MAIHVLAIVVAIVTLAPFAFTISASFKTLSEVLDWPPTFIPSRLSLDNYRAVWTVSPLFPKWLLNSALASTITVTTNLFLCSLAGYAFARLRFPGRDAMFMATLGTLMIPGQITLIPRYIIVHRLGLVDSLAGLVLPDVARVLGVFLMVQFMKAIPKELEEAAKIDGCSRFGTYRHVILPLCKPVMAALAIFTFQGTWNDFTWPLVVLNSPGNFTLALGLNYLRGQYYTFWHLVLTGSLFNILPMLVVFLLFQRYFVQGMSMSGLKG
ncbi:MAG: carbohydrate ABC transporter permease [Firmicutes bacterium]|nr:carbohydrate ABC transporter permease [Bacillota bacterium]